MIPEIKNRKRKRITFFQFYETLNSVEGFYLPLANQQAGATTRFRDTRAFYVAQTRKKIPLTFTCVFTNLLKKRTWAKTGLEDPAKAQDILENHARLALNDTHENGSRAARFASSLLHIFFLRECTNADSREERLSPARGTFYHDVLVHLPY